MIAQQNLLFMYTYLILKNYSSIEEPLNANEISTHIKREFELSIKPDRRTIYAHIKDLYYLSETFPDEFLFSIIKLKNGKVYMKQNIFILKK